MEIQGGKGTRKAVERANEMKELKPYPLIRRIRLIQDQRSEKGHGGVVWKKLEAQSGTSTSERAGAKKGSPQRVFGEKETA